MFDHKFKFGIVFPVSRIPLIDTQNGERRFEINMNIVTVSDEKGQVIQFCTWELEQLLREMCEKGVIKPKLSIW